MKSGAEILSEFLNSENINPNQLALKMKLSRTQPLYDITNGKIKKISENYADKILEEYPQYNKVWLLTGEGEMLKGAVKATSTSKGIESYEVPLLPISAHGGRLDEFTMSIKDADCEKIISPIKDISFAMTVTGHSMEPEYPNGAQVMIKKIDEKSFIDWGGAYVLDTCNGVILKRVIPSEKEGFIRCVSDNNPEVYAPFDVSLSDIWGVYKVKLCMSLK